MTHDTSKDPRILVAEFALKKLGQHISSKSNVRPGLSREETNDLLSKMESQIMALKYSYMPPDGLAESEITKAVMNDAKKLQDAYMESINAKGTTEMSRAALLWSFNIFNGLPRRFGNRGNKMCSGIDLLTVRIRNITKKDKLYVTRSVTQNSEMTIVTNIEGLKQGDTLRTALLPPMMLAGTVSGAMFLGDEKTDEEPGTFLDPDAVNTKEADGILFNELSKK